MSDFDYEFSSAATDLFTSGVKVGIACDLYAMVGQGWNGFCKDGSLKFDLARFLILAQQAGHDVAVFVDEGDNPSVMLKRFQKDILPKLADEMGLNDGQREAFRDVLVGARGGGTSENPHLILESEISDIPGFGGGPQVRIHHDRAMTYINSEGTCSSLGPRRVDTMVENLVKDPDLMAPVKAVEPVKKGYQTQNPKVFVSDVNGTLYDGDVLREDYMRALINLHRAGHRVIISSANPEDAQKMLQGDIWKIDAIFDDLAVSAEQRVEFVEAVLFAIHKKGQRYPDGVGLPDVQCDDYRGGLVALHHMFPSGNEFEQFVDMARVSPVDADEALRDFIEEQVPLLEHDTGPGAHRP
ncbi:MAG: hypothetical protein H6861_09590 [Rhodospirillales bacterium]|nr:hypothetical protein [Rhodospirillales bacterium]